MFQKRVSFIFTIVMLFLLLSVAGVMAASAHLWNGPAYTYRVKERGDHTLEVVVGLRPGPGDAAAMQRYQEANAARVALLIEQREEEPIYVQITFTQPLPWPEARELAQAADMRVENYLMVGTGAKGEKATVIYNHSFTESPPPEIETGPRGQKTTLWGVMVIQGYVPATATGLGRLARDERVEMVDTTAIEVRRAIQRYPSWRGKEIISISLPSPFWDLVWGERMTNETGRSPEKTKE